MNAIKNRNESYVAILEKLPQKKQLILQLIKQNAPCSATDISEKYLIPINEVVARITDLKNEFLVTEAGSKLNSYTKKQNTLYKAVLSFDTRIDLINAHFVNLREKKDSLINDFILGLSDFGKEILKKEIEKINNQIKALERVQGKN